MSDAEEALAFQLRAVGIPFDREVRFAPPRRWRADFQISSTHDPEYLCPNCCTPWKCNGPHIPEAGYGGAPVLIEVDGGTWVAGRHTTGSGFAVDCEKLNEATVLGYRVLRFTPAMVESGQALATIERALR